MVTNVNIMLLFELEPKAVVGSGLDLACCGIWPGPGLWWDLAWTWPVVGSGLDLACCGIWPGFGLYTASC